MSRIRLAVTPQARRDVAAIVAWYKDELGAGAAAKAARSLQAGIRAVATVSLQTATRPDLPEGYYRVVAKTHVILFRESNDQRQIVRVVHGARDIAAALAEHP